MIFGTKLLHFHINRGSFYFFWNSLWFFLCEFWKKTKFWFFFLLFGGDFFFAIVNFKNSLRRSVDIWMVFSKLQSDFKLIDAFYAFTCRPIEKHGFRENRIWRFQTFVWLTIHIRNFLEKILKHPKDSSFHTLYQAFWNIKISLLLCLLFENA